MGNLGSLLGKTLASEQFFKDLLLDRCLTRFSGEILWEDFCLLWYPELNADFGRQNEFFSPRFYFNGFIQHLKINKFSTSFHFTIVHQLLIQMLSLSQKLPRRKICPHCPIFHQRSKRKTKKLWKHFTH